MFDVWTDMFSRLVKSPLLLVEPLVKTPTRVEPRQILIGDALKQKPRSEAPKIATPW